MPPSSIADPQLKGKLEGSWACSAGYDLRIIFSFVQHEGAEAILLETMGTHDEVY
jgi:mRNA-degrading endonuclease YafQ of YafQ-DinJ toxin-antitoxin module